jgi:hypothetical protein
MWKDLTGFSLTKEENAFVIDDEYILTKTAGLNTLTAEIAEFGQNLEKQPNTKYIAVIAVSAGETWGANKNGDYFPREELITNYKTFESGHFFDQHDNKDPKKSYGKVVKAFWNNRMDRVELVVAINLNDPKGQKLMEDLEKGNIIDVSMGCVVPFDVCSICGNIATKRSEYCEHLKYKMNSILPDGRKVYAINIKPRFFDISRVGRGADVTAKIFAKVASYEEGKNAAIQKEIPAEHVKEVEPEDIKRFFDIMFLKDNPIDEKEYKRISAYSPEDVVKTFALLKIPLRPKEIKRIVGPGIYIVTNSPETFFRYFENGKFNHELVRSMLSLIKRRSFLPFFLPFHIQQRDLHEIESDDFRDPGYIGYEKIAEKYNNVEINDIIQMLNEAMLGLTRDIFTNSGKNLRKIEEQIYRATMQRQDYLYNKALNDFAAAVKHQPYYAADPNEKHYKMVYKAASEKGINMYSDYLTNFFIQKQGGMLNEVAYK